MDAQRASDNKAANKAAQELDALFEGTALAEDNEQIAMPPMSEARKELHRAFPDLPGTSLT